MASSSSLLRIPLVFAVLIAGLLPLALALPPDTENSQDLNYILLKNKTVVFDDGPIVLVTEDEDDESVGDNETSSEEDEEGQDSSNEVEEILPNSNNGTLQDGNVTNVGELIPQASEVDKVISTPDGRVDLQTSATGYGHGGYGGIGHGGGQ